MVWTQRKEGNMTEQLIDRVKDEPLLVEVCRAVEKADDILRNLEWFINECGAELLKSSIALGRYPDEDYNYDYDRRSKSYPLNWLAESYQRAQALEAICRKLTQLVEERAPALRESPQGDSSEPRET